MDPTCSDAGFETFGRPLGTELGLDCEVMCAELDLEAKPAGDTPRMQLVFRRA